MNFHEGVEDETAVTLTYLAGTAGLAIVAAVFILMAAAIWPSVF